MLKPVLVFTMNCKNLTFHTNLQTGVTTIFTKQIGDIDFQFQEIRSNISRGIIINNIYINVRTYMAEIQPNEVEINIVHMVKFALIYIY